MHSLANAHSTDDDCTHIIPAHCNLKNTKNQILTICQLQVAFNLVSDCVSWTQHWQQLEGYPQHREYVGQLGLCWHCWCCHLKMPGGQYQWFQGAITAMQGRQKLRTTGLLMVLLKDTRGKYQLFHQRMQWRNKEHQPLALYHLTLVCTIMKICSILSLYFQQEHQATMLNSHHLLWRLVFNYSNLGFQTSNNIKLHGNACHTLCAVL